MNKKIRVASLFSGIGGFEEGLKKSQINSKVVFSSEIDSFAQTSYRSNFPENNLHGDIKKIDEKTIPNHDLLMAGFPCQSFSIAGMQKGFDDIRGTLFFDIARILREKRPRFILLENVKNLVSHDGTKTIVKILNTLTDLEYVVDFTIINSCEAGVPQNRDRTYICGILHGKVEKFLPDVRSEKINKLKKELNKKHFNGFNFFNKVYFNNRQLYIKDILETNVDKSYFLTSNEIKKYLGCIKINDPDITEAKIIKLFNLPKTVHNDLERQRRVYSTKGISPTVLARSDSTKVLIHIDNSVYIRKLTPVENFYVQGFSNDFVNNIKNTY